MANKKKVTEYIINVVISALTALATLLGASSCQVYQGEPRQGISHSNVNINNNRDTFAIRYID